MTISKAQAKRIQESRNNLARKKDEFVLEEVEPTSRQQVRYRNAIFSAIDKTKDAVLQLYNSTEDLNYMSNNMETLFERMDWWEDLKIAAKDGVHAMNNYHQQEYYETVTSSIGVNVAGFINEQGLEGVLKSMVEDNVNMITNLSVNAQSRMSELINKNIVGQNGKSPSLEKLIRESFNKTSKNEAKKIARDQTQRVVGGLNRFRQEASGIRKYKWITSNDNRVRSAKGHNHKIMHGLEVEWATGRIIKTPMSIKRGVAGKNVRNIAGGHVNQEYQCRCSAKPILEV